jgi:hypothetical protein
MALLSCKEVLARHSEFLDGEMAALDADLWRTHLANCAACARYDRILRKGLGVVRSNAAEPDAEFMVHLRYRLAYEEQRMAVGPVTAGAATSVTVAAVLALAAWLPIMIMSRMEEVENATMTMATQLPPATSAIAWHGSNALTTLQPETPSAAPTITRQSTPPVAPIIDRGYTPLVLDAPTAPPTYSQFTFATYSSR